MTVDIAKLRALLAAATPGPWEPHEGDDVFSSEPYKLVATCVRACGEDAALIAALRNAAPELLDELAMLRDKLATAKALLTEGADLAERSARALDGARAELARLRVENETLNEASIDSASCLEHLRGLEAAVLGENPMRFVIEYRAARAKDPVSGREFLAAIDKVAPKFDGLTLDDLEEEKP